MHVFKPCRETVRAIAAYAFFMFLSLAFILNWAAAGDLSAASSSGAPARFFDFRSYTFNMGTLVFLIFFVSVDIIIFFILRDQMRMASAAQESLKILTSNIPGGVSCCRTNMPDCTITEISDGYLDLLECPRSMFSELYKDSFTMTVHPDDRESVLKELEAQLQTTNTVMLQYRIITAKGNVKFLIDRSRLSHDIKGQPCYYCVVIDNTLAKRNADALALSEERYRIVTETADEFLFDWNVETDDVYFSPSYAKRFGKKRIFQILVNDDLSVYEGFINRLLSGAQGQQSAQLRVCGTDGTIIWCSAQGAPIMGSTGKIARVVGILKDISQQVHEHEMLQMKAERDSLTNLYDKGTVQSMISEFLENAPVNSRHAVFICDIDDFKGINDTFGHFSGDKVLIDIAEQLHHVFRSTDIVGRMGGDEFMVLMKDIGSDEALRQKGEDVLKAMHRAFAFPQITSVSGSAGAAVYPDDGLALPDLYQNADAALYAAKRAGKDRFMKFGDIKTATSESGTETSFLQSGRQLNNK